MNSIAFEGKLDDEICVTCENCGIEFMKKIRNLKKDAKRESKTRCRPCWISDRGKSKARPDGYRYTTSNGYVKVKVGEVWVLEHRKVAEEMLGRKLMENEHVHHINQDKQDNRPENLQVMSAVDHLHTHKLGISRSNCVKKKIAESSRASFAKLTADDVSKIRTLISSGTHKQEIAATYNVTTECIYNIANGKSWRSYEQPIF